MSHDGSSLYGQNSATSTVTILDPVGDSCLYPDAITYPDITSMTATIFGGTVTFTIVYTGAFGYGSISLDTDQNPATGNSVPEGQICAIAPPSGGVIQSSIGTTAPPSGPPSISMLGEDYVIYFFNDGTALLNRWDLMEVPPGDAPYAPVYVANLPMVMTATSVEISLDLALIGGDDGNMDFLADMLIDLEGNDRIPNMGHGTLTVAADTTPPEITVVSPQEGQVFLSDDSILFQFGAVDTESGIASLNATVDATVVASGKEISAKKFGVGIHRLIIKAVNGAGLTTEEKVSFVVQGTLSDIESAIVDCYGFEEFKNKGLAYSLLKKVLQAKKADAEGNLKEVAEILDALRKELIAHLQQAEVDKAKTPEISPECVGIILAIATDVLNYTLERNTGYAVSPQVALYAVGGIWPNPPERRMRKREVTDTVTIGYIGGAKNVGKIKLPDMKVMGYPGKAALEKHISKKKIHFEPIPRREGEWPRIRLSLGNVTTADISEGAQLEQEIRIDNDLVAIIHVYIPPQRLIQVIMGESAGNMGLEIAGNGGRMTVVNRYDQTLSPSATGIAWTIKNRVQAILTRDFQSGYFVATAPSYAAVITSGQFKGIDEPIAQRSISRERIRDALTLQEYDLAVETAATVFGEGLMFNRLAIPRGANLAKDDRVYWFFSPPQSGVTTIENVLAQSMIGSAGTLKPQIPAYPLPEGAPAQIVLYQNVPIVIHNVDNRGFAFVRAMVDETTEQTIFSGGTIDGN